MSPPGHEPAEPKTMPLCPVCAEPVRAIEWLLTIERPDDGKRGICKYLVYCARDGARWKWADRPNDEWIFDEVGTAYLSKRFASD